MQPITIDRRYRGPPTSANGGYVCGLVANAIGGSGEVTLRAPPPLDQPLEDLRAGSVELPTHKRFSQPGGRRGWTSLKSLPQASWKQRMPPAGRSTAMKESTIFRAALSVDPGALRRTA